MPRVILVDDSASVRALLGDRLRAEGYDVIDVADAVTGAEQALTSLPSVVVTDLWMPGISGVQLCRLLRAEPATAHVPVVLLTASDDRKSRFWARSAGAVAYVTKNAIPELLQVLESITKKGRTAPPSIPRTGLIGTVHERLSQLLDVSLFESVVAGEVRALAHHEGNGERFFADLSRLASDVVGYRWLALSLEGDSRSFLHAHPAVLAAAETEAKEALKVESFSPSVVITDETAMDGRMTPALVMNIFFGLYPMGKLAMGPSPRGASRDDEAFLRLLSSELGGPLRMLTLFEEARRLAATDMLTGLMNRRAFIEAMGRERSRSERHSFPVSLLLLDIDHFKKINDTRGHAAGDAVLKGVAQVLTRIARKSDLVARWGGEEFVVALTQTSEAGARIAAERVRRALNETTHPLPDGGQVTVTASIGVASCQPSWALDELVTRADEAMYTAKSRGRNRVEVAPPGEDARPAGER